MAKASDGRCLLIIGGGIEQVRAYEVAHEIGLMTVGSDRNPRAPALRIADHAIVASTRDTEETVHAAKEFTTRYRIHGVMTLANDVPLTVASVAAELGLPGISLESARLAADKLAMKARFHATGVPTPEFREVGSPEEVESAIGDWGYPVVLKPIDGRGGRGVLRITSWVDVCWAFQRALEQSDRKRVIVERFVEGRQLSTESMVYRGRCYTVSWSERNYELLHRFAPYIIENGGVLPADLSEQETAEVQDIVARAATSLGITDGPVKGDIVMAEEGPMVIELAARLSGGYLCTDQIPLARGVDLVKQTIRLALGEDLDTAELFPRDLCKLGVRYFFPEPGRIASIRGFNELDRYDWLAKKKLFFKVGDVLDPVTDHTKRAGFVITTGDNRNEAVSRAKEAVARVQIDTTPV